MAYDFLAIGDTAIDAFIRLKEATQTCDAHGEHCQLCVLYAQKIPYESVDELCGVGNSANAGVAAARLDLRSALRSYVGNDDNGRKCLEALKQNNVATDFVVSENGKITNYHYVLWYGVDRTILIKHELFSYRVPAIPEAPRWVYLSSMADKSENYHAEIVKWLNANPEIKLAFQPGTFQIKLGADVLKEMYQRTEIFFCNKEEAQQILKTAETDMKKLLSDMRRLGPKTAVITDGRNGAYIQTDAGSWYAPMYPDPAPPLERTGAGDATSSTTVAYIIKGLSPEEALLRGLINSASVVQHIGAQKGLLTSAQIEEWYGKRPPDFHPTAL